MYRPIQQNPQSDYICNAQREESTDDFCIVWQKLSFVYQSIYGEKKMILSEFSGSVRSGELVAILGPSGVGKSTFLNSLAGMKKPSLGSINFYGRQKSASFAYVPQHDDLCPYLTVKESFLFASKLKNAKTIQSTTEHRARIDYLVKQFALENCLNNLARSISGGESKRLSIALELVSRPNFLLLDEPTSGLDSSTAVKCIDSLKTYVNDETNLNTPAILLTIHQPSSNLFNAFNKVYILSNGACIYEGAPSDMVHYFSKFDIHCPTYCNPADFALDLACEGVGNPQLEKLAKAYVDSSCTTVPSTDLNIIKHDNLRQPTSFFISYFLIFKKLLMCYIRDPQQTMSRLVQYTIFPILSATCLDFTYYKQSSCSYITHNSTNVLPETLLEQIERRMFVVQCLMLLFFNSFFVFMSANFPGILSVGSHVRVFFKEQRNNWYSTAAFSWSFLTVATLMTSIFALLNSIPCYFIFMEHISWVQLVFYCFTNILTAVVGDAQAVLITVLSPNDPVTGIIISGIYVAITITLGGFLIRSSLMSSVAWLFNQMSSFQYILKCLAKNMFKSTDCVVKEDKVFTFDQVLYMLDYYKHKTQAKMGSIDHIPRNIWSLLKEETWNKRTIFTFAQSIGDLGKNGTMQLNKFWEDEANFIVKEFEIDSGPLFYDFGFLVLTAGVFYLIAFGIVLYRTRRR